MVAHSYGFLNPILNFKNRSKKNSQKTVDQSGEYKLGIATDSTGNNTETEEFLIKTSSSSAGLMNEVGQFMGHITIYDNTHIMFEKDVYNGKVTRLIRDTEATKNKTVYFDAVGTESICVDMSIQDAFAE